MRNYWGRAAAGADSSSRPRTNSLRATTRRSTPRWRLFGGWLLQARGELADELGRVEPDGLGDLDELDDVEPSLSALVLCDERLGPFEPAATSCCLRFAWIRLSFNCRLNRTPFGPKVDRATRHVDDALSNIPVGDIRSHRQTSERTRHLALACLYSARSLGEPLVVILIIRTLPMAVEPCSRPSSTCRAFERAAMKMSC